MPKRASDAHANKPSPKKAHVHEPQSREDFLKVYDSLRDELLADPLLKDCYTKDSNKWMREMLDYNTPGGKLNRGMAVYDVLAAIITDRPLSTLEVFHANAVGWCIELLQAFFLVADDMMDGSITRRGQPCWYKVERVGMIAVNDGILLEAAIYRVLKKHFAKLPCYVDLLELFHNVTYQTAHGQLLDLITAPIGQRDLTRYTLDTYLRIVTYKTAFYTFYMPVACGMLLAGITDEKAYSMAEEICVEMGQYFQIQDDVLDCYGDPSVIGKIGTDIEDSKCSWLVVNALERASEAQKQVIREHYGRHEAESVAMIKGVYNELELQDLFKKYETKSYEELCARIEGQSEVPKEVFMALLRKIYKRSK